MMAGRTSSITGEPVGMQRLAYVSRSDLRLDDRRVYDRISSTRGDVLNVFRIMLNSPGATDVVSSVGEYIRFKSNLSPAIREIATLTIARENENDYEWTQHLPIARQVGIPDRVIDAIRDGQAPIGIPEDEGVIVQAAKELKNDGALSESTFQAIETLLGPEQTVDLIVLVGYYTLLSGLIRSLGVEVE